MAYLTDLLYWIPMPDGLYERDILCCSQHQADLLRRLARGERANDVDGEHVINEIEDVGLSELYAVESYLGQLLVHLLKIKLSPDSPLVDHWGVELGSFQKNAARRCVPSMRQRIDLNKLYADATDQLEGVVYDGAAARPWTVNCLFTLEALLTARRADVEASSPWLCPERQK